MNNSFHAMEEAPAAAEYLYRFYDINSNGVSSAQLWAHPIIRRTPKGAWIQDNNLKPRFVNLTARKKFACASIEDALASFKHRKAMQLGIVSNMKLHVLHTLELIDQYNAGTLELPEPIYARLI